MERFLLIGFWLSDITIFLIFHFFRTDRALIVKNDGTREMKEEAQGGFEKAHEARRKRSSELA